MVHSDHRPLIWLLTTSNANSRIARWQLLVAEFDVKVEYISGKENKVADCLSRLRHHEDSLEGNDNYNELLKDENICVVTEEKADMYLEWDLEELIRLQDEDKYYGLLKQLLKKGYDVDTIKK